MIHSLMFVLWILLLPYLSFSQDQAFNFSNCSTLSEDRQNASIFHSISCNIQDELCGNLSKSIPPEPYKLEDNIFSYKPWFLYNYSQISENDSQYDFLYNDSQNVQYQRIGVNITWGPSHVRTIKYLQGFAVTLRNQSGGILVHDVKYFCIHDQLNYHKHIFAKFSYKWFGNTGNVRLYPGQHLAVSVQSLPAASSNIKTVDFKIPNFCNNREMERVYECIELKTFNVSVVELSCSKRFVKVSYAVPSFYGSMAILGLTEIMSGSVSSRRLDNWTNLPLNGSFVVDFNTDYNVQSRYVVTVQGDANAAYKSIDIGQCHDDSKAIAILIPVGICILIIAIALMYRRCSDPDEDTDKTTLSASQESKSVDIAKIDKSVRVFVVYSAIHAGHKNVILSFIKFLQGDLGFHVISELHESENIFKNYAGWIEESLTEADKVLVIWSPNAAKKWNSYNNDTEQKNGVENDLFSPVVIHIRQKLLLHKDPGKYIFGYFEYCSENDIPKEFFNDFYPQLHCRYKLMENFEKLYFRLKGEQQFIPDATKKLPKVESKRYMDKKLNKFGKELFNNIQKMCDYVKEKPLWHEEKPVPETRIPFSNSDVEDCSFWRNQLMIAPLPDKNNDSDPIRAQKTSCEETNLTNQTVLINSNSSFSSSSKNPSLNHTDLSANRAETGSLSLPESALVYIHEKKNKSYERSSGEQESVQTVTDIENRGSFNQCDKYELRNSSIGASESAQPLVSLTLTLEEGGKTLDSGYASSSKDSYQDEAKTFELAPFNDDDDAMQALMNLNKSVL